MKTYYVEALNGNVTGVYKTDDKRGYTNDIKACVLMYETACQQYAGSPYQFNVRELDEDLAGMLKSADLYTMDHARIEAAKI